MRQNPDDRFVWNGLTLLSDGLNSVLGLADSNGVIKDWYQYEPYGNTTVTPAANADPSPYGFTGRENEALGMIYGMGSVTGTYSNGLYYLRGRYYSPALDRFISRDPAGAPGSNLYEYAGDDPVDFRDPTGMGWDAGYYEPDFLGISFPLGVVGFSGFQAGQVSTVAGMDITSGRQTGGGLAEVEEVQGLATHTVRGLASYYTKGRRKTAMGDYFFSSRSTIRCVA